MEVAPPPPQLSAIQALRCLFTVLSDSQFEFECEIERQRRLLQSQKKRQQHQQQQLLENNSNNKNENDDSSTDSWNSSHAATEAAAVADTTTTAKATTTPRQQKLQNEPSDLRYRQLELFKARYHHLNVPTPAKDQD
jgi:septal ring factor EnvC (AmiA/AmiB activator)